MKIFNINRNNRLHCYGIVRSTTHGRFIHVSRWLSGRVLGVRINLVIPILFREKFKEGERFHTKQEYKEMFKIPT